MTVRPIQREGLVESLEDFGIDATREGVDATLTAVPVIQLAELGRNYRPSLACRAYTTVNAGAVAARYSGVSLLSNPEGFWLLDVLNVSAANLRLWQMRSAAGIWQTGASPLFVLCGSEGGQVRESTDPSASPYLFLKASNAGDAGTAPPPAGYTIGASQRAECVPLWIPGNTYLHIGCTAANVAAFFSLDIQFVQTTTGFFG